MPCGNAAPYDVGEIRRDVIERLRANERLMRRRQQRETRSQARAEDADALVPSRREPGDRPPCVEHRLPAHLHRPRDIRADYVVGSGELGWHSTIVIRQGESEGAHTVQRQQPVQADVAARVGVPLREYEDGRLAEASRYREILA